jgi:hypothetical protein
LHKPAALEENYATPFCNRNAGISFFSDSLRKPRFSQRRHLNPYVLWAAISPSAGAMATTTLYQRLDDRDGWSEYRDAV